MIPLARAGLDRARLRAIDAFDIGWLGQETGQSRDPIGWLGQEIRPMPGRVASVQQHLSVGLGEVAAEGGGLGQQLA